MNDLARSRWAPSPGEISLAPSPATTSYVPPNRTPYRPANHTTRPSRTPSPTKRPHSSASDDLSRFMKIVARLKWKLPFLAEGYRLATLDPSTSDTDVSHAEIMFKIDFHEYYALLERAIVHLLGIFGTTVTSAFGQAHLPQPGVTPLSSHRYHANVLEALQDPSCPLYPVLGQGDVHEQLHRAKELRNRWKTADMTKKERERDRWATARRKEKVMPLASYNFEVILATIFQGLEDAYLLAKQHVVESQGAGADERGYHDADWDFIVDAMDWEAV
ncbi:uncharacterized protein BO80DRAFT_16769 [Aspergillus ibericus CBS 121593]|uniref:Uncharacterized protein n=1 Tax=Aspergillus ibericus CBS 121593 TaxID=1448316 RepID=A0A395H727_9EURO|nr:hypothetical protein BO80DRAFT_16769 [Aspergillus ibericus CBS 121593]RAL03303.1 hypothetical protein BO80DRAFT_16769 [Aspergillus ibericus CBS 121593]